MTGGHEDRGRFPPDPQFQHPVEFQRRIKRLHRHHEGGRATGEIQSLFIIGHPSAGSRRRPQELFQAQRFHMVGVVVPVDAELAVAGPVIKVDRRFVVAPDLQPDIHAFMVLGLPLGCVQQAVRHAGPAEIGIDREGIKPRQRRAGVEQQQDIARDPPLRPSVRGACRFDKANGIASFKKIIEIPSGKAIGLERAVFHFQ